MMNLTNATGRLTADLNEQGQSWIKKQIENKNRSNPYFATSQTVRPVVTDYDHWPYTRWFRGVYYYPDPIIAEREAGYRPMRNTCYDMRLPWQAEVIPSHCFEAPCSTVFPCIPPKVIDNVVRFNDSCVVQHY